MSTVVDTVLLDHNLQCPLCDERLVVKASVEIKDVDVRVVGKNGFTPVLSSSAKTEVVTGGIDHRCVFRPE